MKPLTITAVALTLAGCMQTNAPQTKLTVPATAAVSSSDDTLALSCQDLAIRNNNIAKRVRELEAEQARMSRQNAMTDAVLGVGLGAVLGAGAQGGLSGIRTASAAVQGIETVRQAERGTGSLQNVNDSLALMQRSAQLQRAMVEKGC